MVFLDIETTGLDIHVDHIIEIGAIKVDDNLKKIASFRTLMKCPLLEMPQGAYDIHEISIDDLSQAMDPEQALFMLKLFIGGDRVAGHNARKFDVPFIKSCYERLTCLGSATFLNINDVVDTMEISRSKFPKEKYHNLKTCCQRFNIDMGNHHSALDDAVSSLDLYQNLMVV